MHSKVAVDRLASSVPESVAATTHDQRPESDGFMTAGEEPELEQRVWAVYPRHELAPGEVELGLSLDPSDRPSRYAREDQHGLVNKVSSPA
jgi:hypothetical protein